MRADVVEMLERVGRQVEFPTTIRVDQGTEFVSGDLDLWAYQRGVTLDFSRPGKHRQCLHRSVQRTLPSRMSERALVHEPCRRPGKIGGLAQVLQRGAPSWGDRPDDADYATESQWRSQPAIAREPKNSTRRRSKVRPHCRGRARQLVSGGGIGCLTA